MLVEAYHIEPDLNFACVVRNEYFPANLQDWLFLTDDRTSYRVEIMGVLGAKVVNQIEMKLGSFLECLTLDRFTRGPEKSC